MRYISHTGVVYLRGSLTVLGTKTETLTCRIAPDVKAALRAAAAREHRSLANMLEVMVLRYTAGETTAVPDDVAQVRAKDRG